MARRALGPATLAVVQAVEAVVDGPVLLGCSGGADSLALAVAAGIVAARRGVEVRALVVDHGLQAGSAAHAEAVVAQLAGRGVSASSTRVEVLPGRDGPEAAARQARYRALLAAAGDDPVLLGHTLDDQAETVLLGLVRGSGTRSLAGMAPRRGQLVRPLLGLRAATTRQSCAELGLTWWEDPHNADPSFTRVRIRRTVLPMLEAELGPGIAEALARTAELASADADLLDSLAAAELAGQPGDGLACDRLGELPGALRQRVLRGWLLAAGAREATAVNVRDVMGLVTDWHGQGPIDLPGLRVARREGRLWAGQSGIPGAGLS